MAACAGPEASTDGADANAADALSAPPGCADRLATATAPSPRSFERDVMPIFGRSCNFDSCHRGLGVDGHLKLGPPCTFDTTTGDCVLADGALTLEVLDAVHAALLVPSPRGGVLPRVEPSEPSRSFLLIKLADCQDELADVAACGERCGGPMPPPGALYDISPERFDVLLDWVAQGAPR